jgi:hypothetical protein
MPRLGFDWHERTKPIGSDELATAMAPFMTSCIEQFGPDRCMLGFQALLEVNLRLATINHLSNDYDVL